MLVFLEVEILMKDKILFDRVKGFLVYFNEFVYSKFFELDLMEEENRIGDVLFEDGELEKEEFCNI